MKNYSNSDSSENFHEVKVLCLLRLVVRTPGFHPGNRGSTPLGDAILRLFRIRSSLFLSFPEKFIITSKLR